MEITIIKPDREALREIFYSAKLKEEGADAGKDGRGSSYRRGERAFGTPDPSRLALPPKNTITSDERKALVPVRAAFSRDDGENSAATGVIRPRATVDLERIFSSLSINTQSVNNLHTIGKFSLGVAAYAINKYREVQTYRPRAIPTLETYA